MSINTVKQAGGRHCRAVLLLIFSLAAYAVLAGDWPQYRGASHDGVSPDRIMKQWSGSVTNPLWRVTLGAAYSSFAAGQGKAITQVLRNSKEVCVALSITNGTELWSRELETGADYGGYDGPRSTPSLVDDAVYVLTSHLRLLRLNAADGSVVWSNNLRVAYGGEIIGWASAASPLVESNLVYVNLNTGDRSLAAFRTSNGSLAWRVENENMTHSTPVVTTIHGVRQVIFITWNGLVSVKAADGQFLWSFPFSYNGTCLGASPVVCSNIVFITQSYYPRSEAIRIDRDDETWSATSLWHNSVQMIWMTPVCYGGAIFGPTGNNGGTTTPLVCLDLMTGATRWSYNGFGRGSLILVNNTLVGLSEAGWLRLIRPATNAFEQVASFHAITSGSCWNAPAVCDGRLLVRSTTQAACFDLSMPELRVLSPTLNANRTNLDLAVTTTTGDPVHSNRLALMEVHAATNLAGATWAVLTNRPVLSNGAVRVDNVNRGPGLQRFYRVVERD